MCFKPDRQQGRDKLDQWAREREERGETRDNQPALNTHPREYREADTTELNRDVERFEALLGR